MKNKQQATTALFYCNTISLNACTPCNRGREGAEEGKGSTSSPKTDREGYSSNGSGDNYDQNSNEEQDSPQQEQPASTSFQYGYDYSVHANSNGKAGAGEAYANDINHQFEGKFQS